jgi:hypothetical protein
MAFCSVRSGSIARIFPITTLLDMPDPNEIRVAELLKILLLVKSDGGLDSHLKMTAVLLPNSPMDIEEFVKRCHGEDVVDHQASPAEVKLRQEGSVGQSFVTRRRVSCFFSVIHLPELRRHVAVASLGTQEENDIAPFETADPSSLPQPAIVPACGTIGELWGWLQVIYSKHDITTWSVALEVQLPAVSQAVLSGTVFSIESIPASSIVDRRNLSEARRACAPPNVTSGTFWELSGTTELETEYAATIQRSVRHHNRMFELVSPGNSSPEMKKPFVLFPARVVIFHRTSK